eukprot:353547-Chlamydomonas_euryale.AAC.7
MPGLVYASGIMLATEKFQVSITLNMLLIAFGVVICAMGELNLVLRGLIQQLAALGFEVGLSFVCMHATTTIHVKTQKRARLRPACCSQFVQHAFST